MLNLHAILPRSRANGPGLRTVIWFQGCTLACPGCFNPATHSPEPHLLVEPVRLVEQLSADREGIEGITISGGEPFQQPVPLLDLLERLDGADLGRIVFSGYTLEEIISQPFGRRVLAHTDALVAGRYVASCRLATGLLGSANQRIHILTDRYGPDDLYSAASREIVLHRDGAITVSGVNPWRPA
jgi:anaerobic ribonucleoside-triphosphate reductase activating protein